MVAIYWVIMVIMFCCMAMFMWSFIVVQRIRHLLTSLLAWQVVILLSIYCGVTIAYGDQRRSAERTPAAIIILLNFVFVVALDVCRTSIWESYFYLTLMTIGCILGLFGNLFLFDDEVVLTSLTEVSNIRRIPHSSLLSVLPKTYQLLQVNGNPVGNYTLLEIRRSCLTTVLILMCASLKDLANDPDHKRMCEWPGPHSFVTVIVH